MVVSRRCYGVMLVKVLHMFCVWHCLVHPPSVGLLLLRRCLKSRHRVRLYESNTNRTMVILIQPCPSTSSNACFFHAHQSYGRLQKPRTKPQPPFVLDPTNNYQTRIDFYNEPYTCKQKIELGLYPLLPKKACGRKFPKVEIELCFSLHVSRRALGIRQSLSLQPPDHPALNAGHSAIIYCNYIVWFSITRHLHKMDELIVGNFLSASCKKISRQLGHTTLLHSVCACFPWLIFVRLKGRVNVTQAFHVVCSYA